MSTAHPTPEQATAVAQLNGLNDQFCGDPVIDAAAIDGAATTPCFEDWGHGWGIVVSGYSDLCVACAVARAHSVAEDPHRDRDHLSFDVLETPEATFIMTGPVR